MTLRPATTLIRNAHVFTGDSAAPRAEAVAIRNNRIVFAGSNKEAADWRGAATRDVDAGGCTLMPGFIDGHIHLLKGSVAMEDLWADTVSTYDELSRVLAAHASDNPDKPWVTGFGFHYGLGPGQKPLNRHDLDRIVPDRPAFIVAYDLHSAWANTIGLTQAGIFHGADCGLNSQVVLDENGEATGELREFAAMDLIRELLPKPGLAEQRRLLRKGLAYLAGLGITSIQNMDGDPAQASLYADLDKEGELSVRIYVPYSVTPETPLEALERDALAMKQQYSAGKVRSGFVKLFMDGVIEGYTGLLLDEYADNPGELGASDYEPEHFRQLVLQADRLGLQVSVHAVGDAGVRRVLNAYQEGVEINEPRDRRHRIEHIELIHPGDVDRFVQLGVLASMQPLHASLDGQDGDVWLDRVGEARWPRSFAWSTLRGAGARLVFGSDWPCVSASPFLGLDHAVNRTAWRSGSPSHCQTVEDSLLSYTRLAAYAEFQEHEKGQIKPGYLADLVLLSADIQDLPPHELKDVRPTMTMVDGRVVFEC